jgi:hypothetical protein
MVLVMAALAGAWRARRKGEMETRYLARGLTLAVALLPILQTWTVFGHEEVVSENYGLEQALRRNFGKLLAHQEARAGKSGPGGERSMEELSQEVFSQKLLTRDLVLTASPLTDPQLNLPGELYFYASPLNSKPPVYGPRGVSLAQRPDLLFDALLGSAAIYPLFPSRRLNDLPTPGEHVDLVDGSFAHRSPLEAAVNWDATHVLVVEASTQEPAERGNLLDNFGASLSYLYDEAQLTDVRMHGRTALYTLYPSAPHIGLLDFSAKLIEGSIEKGYREASGAPTAADRQGGAWQKELGPPIFWEP